MDLVALFGPPEGDDINAVGDWYLVDESAGENGGTLVLAGPFQTFEQAERVFTLAAVAYAQFLGPRVLSDDGRLSLGLCIAHNPEITADKTEGLFNGILLPAASGLKDIGNVLQGFMNLRPSIYLGASQPDADWAARELGGLQASSLEASDPGVQGLMEQIQAAIRELNSKIPDIFTTPNRDVEIRPDEMTALLTVTGMMTVIDGQPGISGEQKDAIAVLVDALTAMGLRVPPALMQRVAQSRLLEMAATKVAGENGEQP